MEIINILFDNQIFDAQKVGGVSKYYSEIIKQFSFGKDVNPILPFSYTGNEHLLSNLESNSIKKHYFADTNILPLRNQARKVCTRINNVTSQKALIKGDFDIFHPTYYDTHFLKNLKKPFVVTVLDMIHELFPIAGDNGTTNKKKELCEHSDLIFAISHSTKNDLIQLFGIDHNKIKVTQLAGGFLKPNYIKSKADLKLPDYILFVGTRKFYKNFNSFIKAVLPILEKEKNLYVLAVGPEFEKQELMLFEEIKISERVIHKFVKDQDLYHIYHNAELFVFPSQYEGFGIPTLEAFSADCPVVLSNSSSLPEVAGNAALYFDPLNVDEMRNQIENVLYNSQIREKLKLDGKERLKQFSWAKTASQTLEGYKTIVK